MADEQELPTVLVAERCGAHEDADDLTVHRLIDYALRGWKRRCPDLGAVAALSVLPVAERFRRAQAGCGPGVKPIALVVLDCQRPPAAVAAEMDRVTQAAPNEDGPPPDARFSDDWVREVGQRACDALRLVEELGLEYLVLMPAPRYQALVGPTAEAVECMESELGDLLAAVSFVADKNGLDRQAIERQRVKKTALFEEWHEAQGEPRRGDPVACAHCGATDTELCGDPNSHALGMCADEGPCRERARHKRGKLPERSGGASKTRPLSVSTDEGGNVTVKLALDGSGHVVSTLAEVSAALEAHGLYPVGP